jgi:asparagine synthase (glutamine-hydrolysing)
MIAGLLAKHAPQTRGARQSFTVGFDAHGFDETADALSFAKACGFTSHVLRLSDEALRYAYTHAVTSSENVQPYTNGAAKWWLSLLTRQHVRGVLTGDGSDELLCGYPSFRYVKWWMHAMRARKNSIGNLRDLPLGSLQRDMLYVEAFAEQNRDPWRSGSSAQGLGLDFVDSLAMWGVAHPLQGQIATLASLLLGADAPQWLESQKEDIRSWFVAGYTSGQEPDPLDPRVALELWQNYFFHTHLPVQVLNWVGDRMEMANTLEGRTPFLSLPMRRLVARMPDRMLVHGFQDKWILRRALERLADPSFSRQPKKQFGAPFLLEPQGTELDGAWSALKDVGLNTSGIAERLRLARSRVEGILSKSGDPGTTSARDGASVPSVTAMRSAEALYEASAIQQFRQTTRCLAQVHATLVDQQHPLRDFDFEARILKSAQIFPAP